MSLLWCILTSIWLLLPCVTKSASCDSYSMQSSCITDPSCKWTNSKCRCASQVPFDILFGVDTSGSIGSDNFQTQKEFLRTLVTQTINENTRIGFTMFSTVVNASRGIQEWDQAVLEDYVNHIYYTTGWTNTAALLQSALDEFSNTKESNRVQILVMLTDGTPCLPASMGGCPIYLCNDTVDPYYPDLFNNANIRVMIIGVGDALDPQFITCLNRIKDDYIPVTTFDAFNTIMGTLADALCPVNVIKEMKVTEVKTEKKVSGWNNRWGRFIEIYNSGINFNANEITLSGLVEGTGPNISISQGQYVVFYDASDTTYGETPSVPTCHLCDDSICDLSLCPSSIKGVSRSGGYCLCANSVYIACGNTGDGACSTSNLPNGVEDGCTICTFQDSDNGRDIDVLMINDTDSGYLIDEIVYDSNSWITTDDGYSYELISKGFDNDISDNWAQSCSVYGSPGSDPMVICPAMCSIVSCGIGGTCNTTTGSCDCSTGYYCNTPSSCIQCIQFPTAAPTELPTHVPTTTDDPSKAPTNAPTTADPSKYPTINPSMSPTNVTDTRHPTNAPITTTADPSKAPFTSDPSISPTNVGDTQNPTNAPIATTADPSMSPTNDGDTGNPTNAPTTIDPSKSPTTLEPTSTPTYGTSNPANPPVTLSPTFRPTEDFQTGDTKYLIPLFGIHILSVFVLY